MKIYHIETRDAIVDGVEVCPICGASTDGQVWDFVSNLWSKSLFNCKHGYAMFENSNPDEAGSPYLPASIIYEEFIPELEALGYTEIPSPEIDAAKPAIYRLPCSLSGLHANIDNCDPAIVEIVEHEGTPMSDGCVERYITTDGWLVDVSVDSSDLADWFEEELEEVES